MAFGSQLQGETLSRLQSRVKTLESRLSSLNSANGLLEVDLAEECSRSERLNAELAEKEAKVSELILELATKDAMISEQGLLMQRNLMDYADQVRGSRSWSIPLILVIKYKM